VTTPNLSKIMFNWPPTTWKDSGGMGFSGEAHDYSACEYKRLIEPKVAALVSEVGRLRKELKDAIAGAKQAMEQKDTLRAQLDELQQAFTESQEEVVKRGKLLAEAHALLTRTLPYLSNTPDLVQHGAEELAEEIRSASAGQPCYGPNEWGTECGKCSKCKHASAEPSAPECGHAACKSLGEPHPFCQFVKGLEQAEPSAPVELVCNCATRIEANHALSCPRAALERKPQVKS